MEDDNSPQTQSVDSNSSAVNASGVEEARKRDEGDPLSGFSTHFSLPDELYLEGNSLGPLSDAAEARLEEAIEQWRTLGIEGWSEADPSWFWYGERLGEKLAPLLGASPEECVATGTTTTNIHATISTFLDKCDDDKGILVNDLDFPSDHYAIRGQLRQRGLDPEDHLHIVESRDGRTIETDDIIAAMDENDIGIVFMPGVLYRSGQLFDIETITREAHERDIYAGFDLAHSVGAVPHDLSAHGVDFAVWCSYKYLNGGPGAVGGLYINERHFGTMPSLAGWWGHEKETQFDMELEFTPAQSAGGWQITAVPLFSSAPLLGSLELVHEAGIEPIREKSIELTDYLIALVDEQLEDCTVGTPRDSARRGGHVAIEHPDAYQVSQALRDSGAIVDYREPNVIRACPAPLYVSFEETYEFVQLLDEILESESYKSYESDASGVT
ncbi:kynureninase [Halovenus rubra]|uniref:Kynureninase n=2 Tax=Halovenus rubra TaxID=869890 RepID=A0ACC7E5I5_9EURY|nr:kynureninase [Halovenus rubra]